MSDKSLHEQIADLKKAIEAQEGMRSVLGDSVVETTLAVLRDQLTEFERQATQQDAANQSAPKTGDRFICGCLRLYCVLRKQGRGRCDEPCQPSLDTGRPHYPGIWRSY